MYMHRYDTTGWIVFTRLRVGVFTLVNTGKIGVTRWFESAVVDSYARRIRVNSNQKIRQNLFPCKW